MSLEAESETESVYGIRRGNTKLANAFKSNWYWNQNLIAIGNNNGA